MADDDDKRPSPSPGSPDARTGRPAGSGGDAAPKLEALTSLSLPAITEPRGGGAIRSIGETFRANAVTGTGSLSVALPLSPGRAGSGPKLSLSYDSGQGQSVFGLGWGVDIPAITRRTDRGLPQYRDAEESDEFVLSGAEVLVPSLVESSGTWAADAFDEGNYHVQRYRPRIESAFARIEKRTDLTTGEVHWRTTTKDNTTSLFGKSAAARVADPQQPWKVFRWLLEATFDDRGNVTWFEYKAEDTASMPAGLVEEASRLSGLQGFANLHPKRIHYGNQTPLPTTDPVARDLSALSWLFEAVFDYGEHDPTLPTPTEVTPWAFRQDPFSSFRATFDVRTYRLCQRVLMFHTFAELGSSPVLVRALNLGYAPSPVTTLLASVSERGWDGTATADTPTLQLGYTSSTLQTNVQSLAESSVVHLPAGVDGSRYRWLDLDGEGIPGVLTQQGGALFYARNDGDGELVGGRVLRTKPSVTSLGAASQTLTSLDADGQLDLVLLGSDARGFFERTDDGWSPFRGFLRAPNFDPADPNLRFLDIDGDGLADAVLAQDEVFVWSKSLGREGFERPRTVRKSSRDEYGPTFVFADATESIFTADMTGDGLVDLVRIRNGEVSYWPNLGYGRFGGKITMGNSPAFDRPEAFDPKRLRFGDVDGSGTTDIAYLRPDGVALYLNQAGNSWSGPTLVHGIPARRGTAIDIVDLLGTGTACLVWSSPEPADAQQPVRYVDLLASTKPYLLANVINNLGLESRIAYAPSTRYYLEDRKAGSPWVTRLPFPVQVVERVETFDHVQSTRLVTTYRYKHGYFDGPEREFRGFGRVDQWDAEFLSASYGGGLFPPGMNEQNGEFVLPPVHTKSWFDTGAWREAEALYAQYRKEWYQGDKAAPPLGDPVLLGESSVHEAREAARARKGSLLRQEVYADDGTSSAGDPYVVQEHRVAVERLQPMLSQRHPVFFTHDHEAVGRHYERNPNDPRVEHSFVLAVDSFGDVTRSASVAYPRRVPAQPEQGELLASYTVSTFGSELTTAYRASMPVETQSYELTGLPAPDATTGLLPFETLDQASQTAADIAFDVTPTAGVLQRRLFADKRTLYWNDALSASLPLGQVGTRGLVYEAYAKSLTATLVTSVFGARVTSAMLTSEGAYDNAIDTDYWRRSGVYTFDPNGFYQPLAATDPFGNTASVVRDGYQLFAVQAQASQTAPYQNVVTAQYDYRVLAPKLITDPNGNQTAFGFDPLGMLVATAVMGKTGSPTGDSLSNPSQTATTWLVYDLLAWQTSQTPACVQTYAREKHGQNPVWQVTYSYSDGSGHEVLRKVQAAPDANGNPQWIGTGRTVFDNKGNPVKKYEPYYAASFNYESEPSIVMQGVTVVLRYDPLGRVVQTDFPDGTFETVTFDAWTETHADANDNVLQSVWYTTNSAAPASTQMQRAAKLAAAHASTPTVRTADPLGRTFLVVDDNGSLGKYATRSALDIQGNVTSVTDARGNVALRQTFGLEKQVLHSTSIDAGDRYALRDVLGRIDRTWDGRGFATQTKYDPLRRPTQVFVQPPTGSQVLAELVVYGELTGAAAQANNVLGRKVLHYDGAGEFGLPTYDIQGNLTTTTRRLALQGNTAGTIPDWTTLASIADPTAMQTQAGSTLLEQEPAFTTTSVFDALNRVVSVTTPDASTITPTYNPTNLLASVSATLRGSTTVTSFVTSLTYNARSQRLSAVYANGTSTTYTYDPDTFLLVNQTTTGDGNQIQNLSLWYDPVHNVVEIDDNADEALFFNGTIPVAGGGLYTYEPIYRLSTAQGREHPGQQMPSPTDSPLATLPHPNNTQALRTYVETYSYDPVGNLLQMLHQAGSAGWTRQYQVDTGTNRLLAASMPGDPSGGPPSGKFVHDANGNMTSMPNLSSIVWDHANRMLSASLGGGGNAYYTYNAHGQRVRKVIQRIGTLVEECIYLAGYEVYRQKTGTTLEQERQTLHVMDDKHRVAMVETLTTTGGAAIASPAPRQRYQLNGYLESSLVEVDQTGALITYEEYFPFGATSFRSAEGSLQVSAKRYRYTGKERDDETGLYYYGARYYAAWLGRWTSPDPLKIGADGTNGYAYCRNQPTSRSDPTGRQSKDTVGTVEVNGSGGYIDLNHLSDEQRLTVLRTAQQPTGQDFKGNVRAALARAGESPVGYHPPAPAPPSEGSSPQAVYWVYGENKHTLTQIQTFNDTGSSLSNWALGSLISFRNLLAFGESAIPDILGRVQDADPITFQAANDLLPLETPLALDQGLAYLNARASEAFSQLLPSLPPLSLDAAAAGPPASTAGSTVSRASILRELRSQGTPEAHATAKLLTRGEFSLELHATDPWGAGAAGRQPFGTSAIHVYTDVANTPGIAASTAAHEIRHGLQSLTPSTYTLSHEFEAYRWQSNAFGYGWSDSYIWNTLIYGNPHLYRGIPK